MRDLPSGTVTFLFTDIEGSTRLLGELGDGYASALAEHRRVLRNAFSRHHGVEVDTQGDAFFVAFARASDAVAAAGDGQAALEDGPLRVRMGVHTGEPIGTEEGYVGLDVHRAARIAAAGHGGQVLLSQSTRDLVEAAVRDLGEHRLKDLSAPERLFQLGQREFPPLKTLYGTNLPVQPNRLVGREQELVEVTAYLRDGTRLLTLTGAGGSGKTRLALHAAAELADEFADGVWFVPLAPVTDPALVEPTIAQVLGLRGALRDELRSKRVLLVLDNFEQVLEAATDVAELLAATADVRVVATSRERLALAVEQEYVVPTLPMPDAVALFTDRARRLDSTFEPDQCVAEIAHRLDGLPLALELAAARTKVLSTWQIAERLGHSLDLLTGGTRDAPERQRTLRATIEWSYELLAASERRALEGLAVFAGTLSLEAAEDVCSVDVDLLASLVDKSLLRRAADGRFFVLQTIREFALERLEQRADAPELRRRHALYFSALVSRSETILRTADEQQEVRSLLRDNDNIRAALDQLELWEDAEEQARLAGSAWYFWYLTGQLREALDRLSRALPRSEGVDPLLRACVLDGYSGTLSLTGGGAHAARALSEESLAIRRAAGDEHGLLRSLLTASTAAVFGGDPVAAVVFLEECAALAEKLGDDWFRAVALTNLGTFLMIAGDPAAARPKLEEGVAASRAHGDATADGAKLNLAAAKLELGEIEEAAEELEDVLDRNRHAPELVIWSLVWLGAVALLRGSPERAGILAGACDRLLTTTGFDLTPMERIRYEQTLAAVEDLLGPGPVAAAREAGARLEQEEAVELALRRE